VKRLLCGLALLILTSGFQASQDKNEKDMQFFVQIYEKASPEATVYRKGNKLAILYKGWVQELEVTNGTAKIIQMGFIQREQR
jgi:hypothetical protein